MTVKQDLVQHLEEEHKPFIGLLQAWPGVSKWTLELLSKWHARQHHRYSPSHRHGGPEVPSNPFSEREAPAGIKPIMRPRGWYTGEEVIRL